MGLSIELNFPIDGFGLKEVFIYLSNVDNLMEFLKKFLRINVFDGGGVKEVGTLGSFQLAPELTFIFLYRCLNMVRILMR